MKYPYIGKCKENNLTVLFTSFRSGTTLHCGRSDIAEKYKYETGFSESEFKNITAEYLANTKVKIESEEHSELVQNLAFNAGGSWSSGSVQIKNLGAEWHFIDDELLISNSYQRDCDKANMRLITIPLPPKEKSMGSQKEWPQVGDKALTENNYPLKVRGIDGDNVWCLDSEGDYLTFEIKELKKPPTPEDKLKQLAVDIWNENNNDFGDFMDVFVNYIQKKPQ